MKKRNLIQTYESKRDFTRTPEPQFRSAPKKTGLLFVVQKHDARRLHFDFRLEHNGALVSFAIPKGPSLDPDVKRLAVHVEDHPLDYAYFEGKIPKGNYGAGDVIVWDIGTYRAEGAESDQESEEKTSFGLKKGHLGVVLNGKKLKGIFDLVRIKDEDRQWLFIKRKDSYASKIEVTDDTQSVLSERALLGKEHGKENSKVPLPHRIRPMLAVLGEEVYDRSGWLYEIKWDGYRAIAEIQNKEIKLYSRNNISFNTKYPSLVEALKSINHTAVLDGEIIALDSSGRTSFQALQDAADEKTPLVYVLFDIIYLNGRDLTQKTLDERKKILRTILPDHPLLLLSEHIEEKGQVFFKKIEEEGLEGIIAKDKTSPYIVGKRTNYWIKYKTHKRQEAVIGGFTEPRGSRKKFGALILGVYEGNDLIYVGHTGGGFNDTSLQALHTKMKSLTQRQCPFKEIPKTNENPTWVQPKLVCEVKFSEWTKAGHMRQPIFLGLREDKDPLDVTREIPAKISREKKTKETKARSKRSRVEISNPNKVFWPKEGYTKGDVVAYYERIAEAILPYLKDRPESLNRHPNGISGKSFFHKNITNEVPDFVETKKIWSESNDAEIRYLLCQNKETLLYLANLGCIEINPWNSRVQSLNNPDYMIIDLDPGDNTMDELVEVAQITHEVLNIACKENYIKTSGKTGFHVYVPLGAEYSYDQIREFSRIIAMMVYKRLPDITSIERSPAKRKKKIYVDFLQNRRGQTLSAPYSLRPVEGATVSTPLEWSEIKKGLDLKTFNIKTIFDRLKKKGDIWRPVIDHKIDLEDAIRCLEEEFGI